MPKAFLIVLTGDKGGSGKSTVAVLLAEWLIAKGVDVRLVDADPNQTLQTWVEKCHQLGYRVHTPNAAITIVDTPGTVGSSLTRYIRHADVIVVPFQPHVADLEVVVGWFLSLKEALQERVIFVPNRLARTVEQRDGLSELADVLKTEGRGTLVEGLSNRPAVYPPLLNGRATNVFETALAGRLKEEIEPLAGAILARWEGIR